MSSTTYFNGADADIQSQPDARGVNIDQVGVSAIRYPIKVLDRSEELQHTIATLSLSVGLPHGSRGTHLSRFVELLAAHEIEFTLRTIPAFLLKLRTHLEATSARAEVRFPYFLPRVAPVTKLRALMDYNCAFVAATDDEEFDFVLEVAVPVTSLCPCSKSISDYGAHNQRGVITVSVRTVDPAMIVWIEDIVDVAESCASAPVLPLVKRADERFLTMRAYDNPVFVEDMVRAVAVKLQADQRVAWLRIEARNEESIHNHAAFAVVEWRRPLTLRPSDSSAAL